MKIIMMINKIKNQTIIISKIRILTLINRKMIMTQIITMKQILIVKLKYGKMQWVKY